MSDNLYIRVDDVEIAESEGQKRPWKRAAVLFDGEVVTTGFAPNFGIYKQDGIAESSAISLAQVEFCRQYLGDIRGVDDNSPSWIPTLVDTVIRRHSVTGRRGSDSEGSA